MSFDLFVRDTDAAFVEIGLGEAPEMYPGLVVTIEDRDEDGLWLKLGSEDRPGVVAANVDADSVMLSAPEDATQVVIGFGLMLRDLAGGEVIDDLTGQAVDGAFDWEATQEAIRALGPAPGAEPEPEEPKLPPEMESALGLIELLIGNKLLEAEFTAELIEALAVAIPQGPKAVEDALLKHPHVEELYADSDTLAKIVKAW